MTGTFKVKWYNPKKQVYIGDKAQTDTAELLIEIDDVTIKNIDLLSKLFTKLDMAVNGLVGLCRVKVP